jgi:hypothetical protein
MKKNLFLFAILSFASLFITCKKDSQDETQADPVVTDYYPLKVGDYWIYKQTLYDSSGTVLNSTMTDDTIMVTKDTTINSKVYHKLAEHNFLGNASVSYSNVRDSADCIVKDDGKILFSIKSPGMICSQISTPDTLTYANYYYNSTAVSISVPGGTYDCVEYYGEVYRKTENYSNKYIVSKFCSKNIGPVKKTNIIVSNVDKIVLELRSCHIQ